MAHKLAGTPSPFTKASETGKRFKAFFWSPAGDGKTYLAAQFPDPVIIDGEQGTEYVGGMFSFDRIGAYTADDTRDAVSWLLHNEHPYKTLVLDPFTVYWQQVQEKWAELYLEHNPEGTGHHEAYYELQAKDWMPIKQEVRKLLRMLMQLDMNVILTAHAKPLYSFDKGKNEFMKEIGKTFDGEKSLPYVFDVILELFRDDGRYMARVHKDRSGRLPKLPFEQSYKKIADLFGIDGLERETVQIEFATDEQVSTLSDLLRQLGASKGAVKRKLAKYEAETLSELTAKHAADIILALQQKLEESKADDFVDAGASVSE